MATQLPNGPIWLFETCDDFASIRADQFARRIPGGSVVICQAQDVTRTVVLDPSGRIELVYGGQLRSGSATEL
jgi:hypothetical protein